MPCRWAPRRACSTIFSAMAASRRASQSPRPAKQARAAAHDAGDEGAGNLRRRQWSRAMVVEFIGAGAGAPDLITVRGHELIARCPVGRGAGSLAPKALLEYCPPDARGVDTAPMSLV